MIKNNVTDIDLWLYYNLASAALVQKDDEAQLLYEIIRLYEEIIAGLMIDRPGPPESLKTQFQDLQELKTSMDILKIDEKSTERMRRKIQLISLGDRIAQSAQDKDTVSGRMSDSPFLPPKNKAKTSSKPTSKVANEVTKKQNIFSAGLAKLMGNSGKNRLKPIEAIEKETAKDVAKDLIPDDQYQVEDIQSYNVNLEAQEPLEKVIQESIIPDPSKSDQKSKGSIADPDNIISEKEAQEDLKDERVGMPLVESQFSKSLMMLERQVETLNSTNSRVTNIDYLAEFKVRNQERVAKLYAETPNSDRTLNGSSTSILNEAAYHNMYFLFLITKDIRID
jgi:hypothetical protein